MLGEYHLLFFLVLSTAMSDQSHTLLIFFFLPHIRGGHHFIFGGDIDGGKILGEYPSDFVESTTNPIALSRGRMIPIYPWDSMLYSVAEWMDVEPGEEMRKVLPMHENFPASTLYGADVMYKPPSAQGQELPWVE